MKGLICHQNCLSTARCTCGIIIYSYCCFFKIQSTFPACGFTYYLINILIALIGTVQWHSYSLPEGISIEREMNQTTFIVIYAEEFYANAQDKPNYDYDDYDNLNCETINR